MSNDPPRGVTGNSALLRIAPLFLSRRFLL